MGATITVMDSDETRNKIARNLTLKTKSTRSIEDIRAEVEALTAQVTEPKFEDVEEFIPSKEQKRLYSMAMNNVKSFSTNKARKQNIGIVALDLSLLYVDKRYQGLRKHKNIKKLISKWDEKKLGAITVVPHDDECRFAIVDGQGRFMAAQELGYDTLQSIVLLDAPEDKTERLKFESTCFIDQDLETERVKPLEKHLARLIIGDVAAIDLKDILKKYSVQITGDKGSRNGGVLGSYNSTYNISKAHGKFCLDYIFSIISDAGWDKEPNGYATFVTESLKNVWIDYPSHRDEIKDFLSNTLRQKDPTIFSSEARVKYQKRRDTRRLCTLYLEDMIKDHFGYKKARKQVA